jgi:hypothetical protein
MQQVASSSRMQASQQQQMQPTATGDTAVGWLLGQHSVAHMWYAAQQVSLACSGGVSLFAFKAESVAVLLPSQHCCRKPCFGQLSVQQLQLQMFAAL